MGKEEESRVKKCEETLKDTGEDDYCAKCLYCMYQALCIMPSFVMKWFGLWGRLCVPIYNSCCTKPATITLLVVVVHF